MWGVCHVLAPVGGTVGVMEMNMETTMVYFCIL